MKEMTLVNLDGQSGISGLWRLKTVADVLSATPYYNRHSWCGGEEFEGVAVTAVLPDGSHILLASEYAESDGSNYVPDVHGDAPTIGVQLSALPEYPVALIFHYEKYGQNGNDEWEEYLPLTPPDWGKIRRRVEDALRKTTDTSVLFDIGQKLNVKMITKKGGGGGDD